MKSPYTRSWRHTAGPLMWAIVMGVVCAAGPALAQTETGEEGTAPEEPTGETTEFDAYVAAAAEAFQAKNYADALLNFQRAYELDPDPAILFNLGVIADKMGDYELAFTYFNDFVMLPDVDVDDREKALTRLEQVRKLRDLQAEKDKPKKEEKTEDKTEEKTVAPPIQVASEKSYLGAGLLTGLGVAVLGGGAAMAVLASSAHTDFTNATTLEARRSAADSGETDALLADLLFGGGAALTVAGIIWLVVIASDNATETVVFVPEIGADSLGLNMALRF